MERLTKKIIFPNGECTYDVSNEKVGQFIANHSGFVKELLQKLGQYEDAEEQGVLLRLPVAVGSTVYHYCGDFGVILPYTVSSICISSFLSGGIDIVIEGGAYGEDEVLDDFSECLADFKKSFFLTQEEAEQALAEMKNIEEAKDNLATEIARMGYTDKADAKDRIEKALKQMGE